MELLKRFSEIEDGQAAIDNRPAGGAVEDSGVLALLSSRIDDPPAAYLAFRQLADLEASLGAFSQRLTCDPSGLPLWRALRQDPRPGSRLDAAPRGQLPHRRLMRGRPLLKRQINEKLPKPRESARLPQQRDGIKMRWRIDLLGWLKAGSDALQGAGRSSAARGCGLPILICPPPASSKKKPRMRGWG